MSGQIFPGDQPLDAVARSMRSTTLRLRLYILLALADALAISLAMLAPLYMPTYGVQWIPILFVALALYGWTSFTKGAFSIQALEAPRFGIRTALHALAATFAGLFLVSYFLRLEQRLPRLTLLAVMIGAALLLILFRLIVDKLARRRHGRSLVSELALIDGEDGAILRSSCLSTETLGIEPDLANPAMLDAFARLTRGIDRVVIFCPPERRERWAMMLKGANVRGEIATEGLEQFGVLGVERYKGRVTLLVSTGPLALAQRIMKRMLDISVTLPLLILISPALLAVAVAIKLDSKGPVFFKQRRVGRGNAFFNIYKFRSMITEQSDSEGRVSASRDDNRITRVGRLIRRTSIDELPQLFNVLLGSMSLVGPRPHALGSLAGEHLFWEVNERYWHRHVLKPGITGLAQVRGFRGATHHRRDLEQRLQADLEYIANWSLWQDIVIIISTLKVAVHRNAY